MLVCLIALQMSPITLQPPMDLQNEVFPLQAKHMFRLQLYVDRYVQIRGVAVAIF
jgi:hypothetical protein